MNPSRSRCIGFQPLASPSQGPRPRLYAGPLGKAIAYDMADHGGVLSMETLPATAPSNARRCVAPTAVVTRLPGRRTSTLHELFGSRVTVSGRGMLLNDCMELMDPVPGHANSIAPVSAGGRVEGRRAFLALGSVGGLKIFGSVAPAIVNVVDHGMSIQQAVEAPRMFDRGHGLEVEISFPEGAALKHELERRGHALDATHRSGGGMNGILLHEDGRLEGAADWRADGVPMGFSGGDAFLVADAEVTR